MAAPIQNTPNRAAFDVRNAQDLRSQFQTDPKEGLKAAAQQFETLFLQMVMKSMRDTVPQDGLLDSDQSRFFTGLLDQQMAQDMATKAVAGYPVGEEVEVFSLIFSSVLFNFDPRCELLCKTSSDNTDNKFFINCAY